MKASLLMLVLLVGQASFAMGKSTATAKPAAVNPEKVSTSECTYKNSQAKVSLWSNTNPGSSSVRASAELLPGQK